MKPTDIAPENIADRIYRSYEFGKLASDVKKCLAIKLLVAIEERSTGDGKNGLAWLDNLSGAWVDDGLSADAEADLIRGARKNNVARLAEDL